MRPRRGENPQLQSVVCRAIIQQIDEGRYKLESVHERLPPDVGDRVRHRAGERFPDLWQQLVAWI